jgi:hypothetical protein
MPQDYDVTLKEQLRRSRGRLLTDLCGAPVAEWLNVELPRVSNRRVDLLARLADERLVHLELQVRNDAEFARRQAEYYLALWRQLGEHVEQIALYVGREPLRMESAFRTPTAQFRFRLIDLREWDGSALLASDDLADNLLAVLTKVDPWRVARRVAERLEAMQGEARAEAAAQFVILSGLRGWAPTILRGIYMTNQELMDVLLEQDGICRGLWQRGKDEALREAVERERSIVSRQIQKRFGPLPAWAQQRVQSANEDELEQWALALLDARSLEELLHGESPAGPHS